MDAFTGELFAAAMVGAFVGLLYPALVALFRSVSPVPLAQLSVSPTIRWIIYVVAGLILAAVLVALGFTAFLGDEENRQSLKDSGSVAYFAAFSYGFASASLIEEPLKRR